MRAHSILIGAAVVAVACGGRPCAGEIILETGWPIFTEDWTSFSTFAGGVNYEIEWEFLDGNPDGHIKEDDPDDGDWLFAASEEWRGDQSVMFENQLVYDVFHTGEGDLLDPIDDVVLISGALELGFDIPTPPADEWVTIRVPFDERGPWFDLVSGKPATNAQILAALSDLELFWVRGEYHSGDDTARLDNFIFRVCLPDLDDNAVVNFGDVLVLLSVWGTPHGDTNADGTTDFADLLELLSAWGPCSR